MSTSDGSLRARIGDVAERIATSIGQPIRGVSLFYALYYLVEIEGVQEAAFDFNHLRSEYYDAIGWYGVYTALTEFSHVNSRCLVAGGEVTRYLQEQEARMRHGTELVTEQLRPADLDPHAESLIDPADLATTPYAVTEIEALARDLSRAARDLEQIATVEPSSPSGISSFLAAAQQV